MLVRRGTKTLAFSIALMVGLACFSGSAIAARPGHLERHLVTDGLSISDNSPTWGAQIPKLIYDGKWFYAIVMDQVGSANPGWLARIFRSRHGKRWEEAFTIRDPATGNGYTYQPLGLLLDRRRRLHLIGGCFSGGQCYPGVPSADPSVTQVYTLHLILDSRRPDGSIDFRSFRDASIRAPGVGPSPAETSYQGLAIDPSGRYIYQATNSLPLGQLWLRVFDTETGALSSTLVDVAPGPSAGIPCGRAWLYPQVRVGRRGVVSLTARQYALCGPAGAADSVLSWRSVDGGASFSEATSVVGLPSSDGARSYVNNADTAFDSRGVLQLLFFVKANQPPTGYGAMYYQRGLHGRPVKLGSASDSGQIVAGGDHSRFIFSVQPNNYITPVRRAGLSVSHSPDGVHWRRFLFPFRRYYALDTVSLLARYAGSRPVPKRRGRRRSAMIVPAQTRFGGPYSSLLFLLFDPRRVTAGNR